MSVYSKEKVWYFAERLKQLRQGVNPVHVRIYPTNKCNHNCYYCAYKNKELGLGKYYQSSDKIPYDKLIEIIKDCEMMRVRAITFTGGGEPLLYPDFLGACQVTQFYNIPFGVYTNGELLTGATAAGLKKMAAWVRISIDGHNNQTYSDIRRVPLGTYDKVLQNIKEFQKLPGRAELSIAINFTRKRPFRDSELKKKLEKLGVERIQLRYVSEEASEWETSQPKPYKWCPNLQLCPVIGADLNVWSCCDKAYNYSNALLGNLQMQSFQEAWRRIDFKQVNPEKDCLHKCMADEKNKRIMAFLEAKDVEFI